MLRDSAFLTVGYKGQNESPPAVEFKCVSNIFFKKSSRTFCFSVATKQQLQDKQYLTILSFFCRDLSVQSELEKGKRRDVVL